MPTTHATRPGLLIVAAVLLMAASVLTACDNGGEDPPNDTTTDSHTMPPSDVEIMEVDVTGDEFELGSHGDFVTDTKPPDFAVLTDGGYLPIVQGGQGINMVLVGFRTNVAMAEPMVVRLELEVEGDLHSRTTWDFQRFIVDEGEGWHGLYNMFIGLDGCDTIADGTAGAFTITITDANGLQIKRRIEVSVGENDLCFG